MALTLRRFIPFQPEEILTGPYGDWILLILLCGLFIAVSGAVLPRHLVEKRYGKAVVIFTGLMLGIGLFKAKEIYNFNLEAFGFLAIWLLIIVMGFVIYGLTKMGMAKTTALSVSYVIIFLSFFLLTPSLFDSIAESFPLVNLIFIILFFYMIGKPIFSAFNSKSPLKAAKKLSHTNFTSDQDIEIEKEETEDRQETKDIKKKTIPETKTEIKSIDDIKKQLSDIIQKIQEHGSQLTEEDKKQISDDLKRINQNENLLKKGTIFIKRHVNAYNRHHRRDLSEIHQRLNRTTKKDQRQILQEEIKFHQTMLQVINFLDLSESKVFDFCKSFNDLLYKAINRLTLNNVGDARSHLNMARKNLEKMDEIYSKQKWYEHFLLKYEKRLIKDLKKEKIAKNHN